MSIGTPASAGTGFLSNSTGTVTMSPNATIPVGTEVIIFVGDDGDSTASWSSVTDTGGNTYTPLAAQQGSNNNYTLRAFKSRLTTQLTTSSTITGTKTSPTGVWDKFIAAIKMTSTNPLELDPNGGVGGATGSGTSWNGGATPTTATAVEMIIGFAVCGGAPTTPVSVPTGSYNEIHDVNTGSFVDYTSVYQAVSATGAYTAAGTWSFTDQWAGRTFAFREQSSTVNVNAQMVTSGTAITASTYRKGVSRAAASSAVSSTTSAYRKGVSRTSTASAVGTTVFTRLTIVNVNSAMSVTAIAVSASTYRKGVIRSSVTTGAGTTVSSYRAGKSRSTQTTGASTTASAYRRGVNRVAGTTCAATSAFAYRKGVIRQLATSAGNFTIFTVAGIVRNVNAQMVTTCASATAFLHRMGISRAVVCTAAGSTSSSRVKGVLRSHSSSATGSTSATYRKGVSRGTVVAPVAETLFAHRKGVFVVMSVEGISSTSFTRPPGIPVGGRGHFGRVLGGSGGVVVVAPGGGRMDQETVGGRVE